MRTCAVPEWTDPTSTLQELSVADLRGANLSRACLIGAKLDGANLRDANLTGASLRNADLSGTDFIATNLRGADVDGAVLNRTVFASIDFRSLRGVEGLVHRGPSVIGIDTMYLSKGEFSEIFMRGAGMPDSFIAIARSLAGQAGTFFSCFISYSTKDQDFADRLHADLQNKGVRCWFAPYNISGGKKLREQIDEAIRLHDRLLLILSEHSMNSEWVQTEIAHARQKELTERRQVLFPISLVVTFARIREWKCFDADTGKDSARELREYFIPDFSNWKDGNFYQKGLERLLQDLKSEPARRFR